MLAFRMLLLHREPALHGVGNQAAESRIRPPRHVSANPIDTVRSVVNNLLDCVGCGPGHIVCCREDLADWGVQIGEETTGFATVATAVTAATAVSAAIVLP